MPLDLFTSGEPIADTKAPTDVPIAERWSTRVFDPETPIDETARRSALEAARWAPSGMNHQPWRLILARRLALAARHLQAGEGTVLTAATAAGFGDLSEFTRQFRQHFGITPGVYSRALNQHKLSAADCAWANPEGKACG